MRKTIDVYDHIKQTNNKMINGIKNALSTAIESNTKNRENLEELVFICLTCEEHPISIGKGKELLGFKNMNEMREWINTYVIRN
jgi:hypothetical protein